LAKLLWTPSEEVIQKANITRYIEYVSKRFGLGLDILEKGVYFRLYRWSVENIPAFWMSVWDFCGVAASRRFYEVVDDLTRFPGARWFNGATLNFAENLLRGNGKNEVRAVREDGVERSFTYHQLYMMAGGVARGLREAGVGVGDAVVGYMPTTAETTIAMLGAASIGATWSSTGTEIGVDAAIDRFSQLSPKALFTVDAYFYRGKKYDVLERVRKIVSNIPSIKTVVVLPYVGEGVDLGGLPGGVLFRDFVGEGCAPEFVQVPASTPIYIMFSSGTTGKPKCMAQSVAGVLVNHLKELIIHTDLKPGDVITYITSPSWMMWNWLMTSLATGATVLLYDGDPNYPDWRRMWRLIEENGVSIFGCSASYINNLRGMGASPRQAADLTTLREISQTGSPLSADGFEWIYREVKQDLHFNSISGGTDINGCFAIGSPILPVYAGQLQSPALGMKVKCYDEEGNEVYDREGELVCEAPSPSMPLYFLNDPGNEKYLDAYFRHYTHKRVWRHGDYVIFHTDTGGITFLGRSDATLKPSGVRIGTAEIYSVVETIPEIADSLAVGQNWKGDQRIILFVKMAKGHTLTEEVKEKIRRSLRERASPRHVPAVILEVPDIPYTYNLKKVETAVANLVNRRKVVNRDAIMNPEALDYIEKLLPTLWEQA
jgi:acetoacetyl-CoA synthetase